MGNIHLVEALARAHQHWEKQHTPASSGQGLSTPFTIAFTREAGTYGAAIAREVANRLGWPVYDRELLQRIADDMGVQRTLLESVDERHVSWLSECLEGFFSEKSVSQSAYFRRLVETMFSLAAHGECVIVGRGATKILPLATTLRVRVVAPLNYRIEAVRREHGISPKEAATLVKMKDEERHHFLTSHFPIDPTDPRNYDDVVLNVARFFTGECADLILAALGCLRSRRVPNLTPS